MQYIEDGEAKAIEYEVESVIPGATTGVVRDYTISLKCTDPYFKDLADIEVVMASWVSDFYFPACFPEAVSYTHLVADYDIEECTAILNAYMEFVDELRQNPN